MSFATRSRFAVSTSARLSAFYGALLILAFAMMGAAIVATTNEMTTYELRGPLLKEAAFVREVIATEGLDHAIDEINLRTEHSTLLVHRLDDAHGRLLAGDAQLPHPQPGWSFAELPRRAERGGEVFLLTADVGEGAQLTVGIELVWPHSVRDATLRKLAVLGAIVLSLALIIGLFFTNASFRRMRALWNALRKAGEGDFAIRAPVRNARAPDDIDALAIRFNEMMDHTDHLVANVKRVSTNVAHDLRTPLTHLAQRLDRAIAAPSQDAAREDMSHARSKIDEILRLFESMLHLSELQTGRLKGTFQTFAPAATVERVLDAYRPQIEERGGEIVAELHPTVRVHGDEALIARALSNLLENAERHAGAGKRILVTLAAAEDSVSLAVADEGPGLSPDAAARALEPFERLDQSRAAPGYGLGLPIVAAIVALHAGELKMEDAAPGLRVTLRFPVF